jgi:hypothetical protein
MSIVSEELVGQSEWDWQYPLSLLCLKRFDFKIITYRKVILFFTVYFIFIRFGIMGSGVQAEVKVVTILI